MAAPAVCGHRGVPSLVAENTVPGFELAIERGATWLEFDVRPTLDDRLVVHHDPVTPSGERIASTPRAALAASIPELSDVFRACPTAGLDIELKADEVDRSPAEYAALVAAELAGLIEDGRSVVVTSFDEQLLANMKACAPAVDTGFLYHEPDAEGSAAFSVDLAVEAGHSAIAPWHPLVDESLVAAAHAAGLTVMTWTVNDRPEIDRVRRCGVDMIISDDPADVVAVLESTG